MDRIRRSLRESFRRKKDHVPECSKPHQWQADETAVRAGTCNFHVKYLGCVEVYESRGMQICEEALKVLRNSRRRPIKGVLYVTGDGLRVVDDDNKGLIVDQTIEKVSFCAPDRNHDRGFSYICRDGTTRRWMCHGFLATKDVNAVQNGNAKNLGERLSHAVGCAFAVCLERKQKRDKECGVQMSFDASTSTFTRTGSFRQTTLTERMQDPQECKPAPQPAPTNKSVVNPYAVQRPHASQSMLERQGSFRGFNQLNQTSPFKRQLSLRLNELPSTLERQQNSLTTPEIKLNQNGANIGKSDYHNNSNNDTGTGPGWKTNNNIKNHSMNANKFYMSPIPESSPVVESEDSISAMCKQVTQGLSLLSNNESQALPPSTGNPWAMSSSTTTVTSSNNNNNKDNRAEQWLASSTSHMSSATTNAPSALPTVPPRMNSPKSKRMPHLSALRSQSLGAEPSASTNLNLSYPKPSSNPTTNGNTKKIEPTDGSKPRDPFDAEWAAIATRHEPLSPTNSNNPFQQNRFQAFEVHM